MCSNIDRVINKVREKNPGDRFFIIYVNANIYNQIQEEIENNDFDYNSPTILMLQKNSLLVIDKDLTDDEIVII
ncbi:MAG: hypothetical protein ACI4PE_02870 [Bacilli bacterium]